MKYNPLSWKQEYIDDDQVLISYKSESLGELKCFGIKWPLWHQSDGKYMFVSHTKHMQRKINGSTSFAIDNMYNVSFRI